MSSSKNKEFIIIITDRFKAAFLLWFSMILVIDVGITKTRPCNIQQYFTAVKNVHFQMKLFNIFH